jgi:hypothetical protein
VSVRSKGIRATPTTGPSLHQLELQIEDLCLGGRGESHSNPIVVCKNKPHLQLRHAPSSFDPRNSRTDVCLSWVEVCLGIILMSLAYQNSTSPLDQINDLLSKADKDLTPSKSLTISIGSCCRALENGSLSDSDFAKFLREVHDHIVTKDTAIRSVLLRSIRYGMKTPESCQLILDHVSKSPLPI